MVIGLLVGVVPEFMFDIIIALLVASALVPYGITNKYPLNFRLQTFSTSFIILGIVIFFAILQHLVVNVQLDGILGFDLIILIIGVFINGIVQGYLFHSVIQASLSKMASLPIIVVIITILMLILHINLNSIAYSLIIFIQTIVYALIANSGKQFQVMIAYGFMNLITYIILPFLL